MNIQPYSLPGEEWRDIPDTEFYQASDQGRVRSINRVQEENSRWGPRKRFYRGTVLVNTNGPKTNGGSAVTVSICEYGEKQTMIVGRLVWVAFNGEIPEGWQIGHLDYNWRNVKLSNLFLAEHALAGRARLGYHQHGEEVPTAKLTSDAVREIREWLADGSALIIDIAEAYGVTATTISAIKVGRSWKRELQA